MPRTSTGRPPVSYPSRRSWSSEVRKAASVLPEPVGAAISVASPRRLARQPSTCASVGSSKRLVHHWRRSGRKYGGSEVVILTLDSGTHSNLSPAERKELKALDHNLNPLLINRAKRLPG